MLDAASTTITCEIVVPKATCTNSDAATYTNGIIAPHVVDTPKCYNEHTNPDAATSTHIPRCRN